MPVYNNKQRTSRIQIGIVQLISLQDVPSSVRAQARPDDDESWSDWNPKCCLTINGFKFALFSSCSEHAAIPTDMVGRKSVLDIPPLLRKTFGLGYAHLLFELGRVEECGFAIGQCEVCPGDFSMPR